MPSKPLLRKTRDVWYVFLFRLLKDHLLIDRSIGSHDNHHKEGESFGKKHGIFILVVISLLLLVREGFVMVIINNKAKQNDESF